MRPQPSQLLPAILVGSLVLAACGSDDDSSADEESADTAAETADTAAEETADTAAEETADTTADTAAEGDGASADEACSNTIEDGVLTVATGEPAFFPWVIDDDPTTGEGFEAAVAYAVAAEMGYEGDAVEWTRTTFDGAIQPGAKDFDVNLQQFSITDERSETIDFSLPYYTSNQAIVALEGSAAEGATSIADLQDVKFGAQAGTTSLEFINDVIQPSQEAFVYDDNVGAKAALDANQIDAAVFDLPTALYVSAVEIEGSSVIGQFPAESGGTTDQFGMVLEKDSALTPCVDAAIQAITDDGTLDALTQEWLSDTTGAPVIAE
ncbi:ABC transporter substrate-binding protein [Ilumatobacter nonamiensis]|uniref:ABC transporter substrate-binding protein n=1 Tax=Ilumatobacter nonamiensis TaxID=467093 RepID=UPI000344E713|nr:ABC transporter substrate-binding protein [Ilumatobacter nonamiensis]